MKELEGEVKKREKKLEGEVVLGNKNFAVFVLVVGWLFTRERFKRYNMTGVVYIEAT